MKFETILFDMDGVLIDSEELMSKSGVLALKEFGIEAKPEDFIPFVGCGENRYMGGVAEKYGVPFDPKMKERCYYHYGQYIETDAFVPEQIPALLYRLKDLGYKVAVCTSADWGKVKHNLRAIGVDKDFFDGFVTGDYIQNLKPHPEIYLTGARITKTAPEKCIVVEDAPSGIKAAHAGGMQAIALTSSFSEEYLVKEAAPDKVIHSLDELEDALL